MDKLDFGEPVEKFGLPQKGGRLFQETSNYYEFAHFGWGLKSSFYGYIRGYKEVSDKAVEFAVQSKDIAVLDTHVFPIIFNYRQFLELSLKSLYLDYSSHSIKEKIATLHSAGHDLMKMWQKLEPILLNLYAGNENKEMVNTVKSYIKQFHDTDRSSFNFRYPITKEMVPVFKTEKRYDLVNLKTRMQELSNYFDGADGQLDYLKSCQEDQDAYRRELEAEMRAIQAEYEAEARKEYEAEARAIQAEYEAEARAEYEAEARAIRAEIEAEMRAEYAAEMRANMERE